MLFVFNEQPQVLIFLLAFKLYAPTTNHILLLFTSSACACVWLMVACLIKIKWLRSTINWLYCLCISLRVFMCFFFWVNIDSFKSHLWHWLHVVGLWVTNNKFMFTHWTLFAVIINSYIAIRTLFIQYLCEKIVRNN